MEVSLDKRLEGLVGALVSDGQYASESEVVADRLRLIEERERVRAALRARLQVAIDEGGEASEEDIDAALDACDRELASEGL